MPSRTQITLDPRLEAALVAYVALFDTCKTACRKLVREAVLEHGRTRTAVVYRGQARQDAVIKHTTPFFSATPKRKMAELFVERDWEKDDGAMVGHLFKIHLIKVPTLSTRDVLYTLNQSVMAKLRAINKGRPISKGNGEFTFDEFAPRIKKLMRTLVHQDTEANGAEILVPTGGTFYQDAGLTRVGFTTTRTGMHEAWYTTASLM